jgi:hypothetical protein
VRSSVLRSVHRLGRGAPLLAVVVLALAGFVTFGTVGRSGGGHRAAAAATSTRGAVGASGSKATLLSTDNLPADCIPNPSGPPGSPYELGLVGNVTNGELQAGPADVADITAKFCGIVTVVGAKPPCGATGDVSSPMDGQIFGSVTADLTFIPSMQPKVPFVAHPGVITGGFTCAPSNNGLLVTLDATVSGTTGLFGLSCTIGPLTIPLSGLITGPLNDTTGVLTANHFSVPEVTPSSLCGGPVPAALDQLAGLPIAPGGASAKLYVTASLYQPPPPSG